MAMGLDGTETAIYSHLCMKQPSIASQVPHTYRAFTLVLGVQILALTITKQTLCPLSHLPFHTHVSPSTCL